MELLNSHGNFNTLTIKKGINVITQTHFLDFLSFKNTINTSENLYFLIFFT